ncbi:MAG: 2-amino-4-hydroxy-6-hydroxymethyldihydropteridine diphosphokinase [Acidobacteriota bacterium]|nr:2-amino-4-hydroxy-6-hydroxymethyldihydropteridine diphosphokinase [Acidobacteriota bacterium]
MKTVYLGLGSNVGERERMLQSAVDELQGRDLRIARLSPVYETEPQDFHDQRWFLNLVVEAQTSLFPMQLLARIAKIERALGRKRVTPKGPRTIDIDILFYGNASVQTVVQTAALQIPHPRYAERRFVLAPLADLAPDLRDPVSRKTMRELLAKVSDQNVRQADIHIQIHGLATA